MENLEEHEERWILKAVYCYYFSINIPSQKLQKANAEKQEVRSKGMLEPLETREDQTCTSAFHHIIQCLGWEPVLAFADPNKSDILHADANLKGLGAILYQEYPEELRPVAFASRKFCATEQCSCSSAQVYIS